MGSVTRGGSTGSRKVPFYKTSLGRTALFCLGDQHVELFTHRTQNGMLHLNNVQFSPDLQSLDTSGISEHTPRPPPKQPVFKNTLSSF